VDSVRYINTAEITFASTYPNIGFASDLATLGPGATLGAAPSSTNAILLDGVLGAPSPGGGSVGTPNQKSGYYFYLNNVNGVPASTYSANANPITYNQTGKRYFYNDASGVIRYNPTQVAASTDSSIQ
jgi:hypothetical protein